MKNNNINKGLEYYKEYITELEKVKNILNNHNFKLDYSYSTNSLNLKYSYKITIDKFSFNYSEGEGHEPLNEYNKGNKIINALHCLITDYQAGLYDFDDFVDNFGYDELKEANKIYNECKKTTAKMLAIFTNEELETLQENISL